MCTPLVWAVGLEIRSNENFGWHGFERTGPTFREHCHRPLLIFSAAQFDTLSRSKILSAVRIKNGCRKGRQIDRSARVVSPTVGEWLGGWWSKKYMLTLSRCGILLNADWNLFLCKTGNFSLQSMVAGWLIFFGGEDLAGAAANVIVI